MTDRAGDKRLFWACFLAMIATAFGFIIRAMIIDDWGQEFNFSATQKGELLGVGLWPFAISIILFSLIIDRIGYGTAMVFAFVCHVASAAITILGPQYTDDPYWVLWAGTFICALGNGTVEAVTNPVTATLFPREKTKWLNALHAGWPAGLVVGGVITLAMGQEGVLGALFEGPIGWKWKVGLILIPTVLYALMMLTCKFPVSERVAAGVSYREMLREFGAGGALIAGGLVIWELTRVGNAMAGAALSENALLATRLVLTLGVAGAFGVYTRSLGRPLFVFMLLIMIPLATAELGTDSWISSLMEPVMANLQLTDDLVLHLAGGWVLVYTSLLMMILRFCAGPIVHKLSPIGLLMASAVVAACGLAFLSQVEAAALILQVEAAALILVAATVYGFGKTFFWPTMLGVVAEQSPRGGALTLNATGGVGMLGVGVVGAVFLGYIQDTSVEAKLAEAHPQVHAQVVAEKHWVFGSLQAVDPEKVEQLPAAQQKEVETLTAKAKQSALLTVAIFPLIMLVCYIGLFIYFRAKGGYRAEVLTGGDHPEKDAEFTGGVPAAADK